MCAFVQEEMTVLMTVDSELGLTQTESQNHCAENGMVSAGNAESADAVASASIPS